VIASPRPARRGAILLVVLTLLALFAVIGLGFALYAESEATSARAHREAAADSTPADDLAVMDETNAHLANLFVTQLLYGGTGTTADALSAAYGNDLARTKFVSNVALNGAFAPPVVGPQLSVFAGGGPLTSNTDAQALVAAGIVPATTLPPGSQQPLVLPWGAAVPREEVTNYSPVVDPNPAVALGTPGKVVSVLPEHTGYQTFAGGGWVPSPAHTFTTYSAGTGPQFVSRAAGYTYPDVNNLYLAQVRPDTGEIVVPSYYRPHTFGVRLNPAAPVNPASGTTPQTLNYDSTLAAASIGPATALQGGSLTLPGNPNWYTRSGRLRIARPRPWDQLRATRPVPPEPDPFGGKSEQEFIANLAGVPYPIPEDLTPADAGKLTAALLTAAQQGLIASLLPFPPANPDGSITGDVQNLRQAGGTAKNDSVWVYPGGPVLNWRGRRLVALVAPMILDLSSRANINVVANSPTFAGRPQIYPPPPAMPPFPPDPSDQPNPADPTGQSGYRYTAMGTQHYKLPATRSSLGTGPHEINVAHLMLGANTRDVIVNNPPSTGANNPQTGTASPPTSPGVLFPTFGLPPVVTGRELAQAIAARNGSSSANPTGGSGRDRYSNASVLLNGGRPVPAYTPGDLNAALMPAEPQTGAPGTYVASQLDVSLQFPPTASAVPPAAVPPGPPTYPTAAYPTAAFPRPYLTNAVPTPTLPPGQQPPAPEAIGVAPPLNPALLTPSPTQQAALSQSFNQPPSWFTAVGGPSFSASSLLFPAYQWPRAAADGPVPGPHQVGFETTRRTAGRYGASSLDALRVTAVAEAGGRMPTNLGSPGGPMPTPNGEFSPSAGGLARSLLTTFSTSMNRAELTVNGPLLATGPPPQFLQVKLGPIDLARVLPDYRVSEGISLSPANIFPLAAATPPLTDDSNVQAYKKYAPARQARQNLARDIFVRLVAAAGAVDLDGPGPLPPVALIDGVDVAYDPATGYLAHYNPTTSPPRFEPLVPPTTPPVPLVVPPTSGGPLAGQTIAPNMTADPVGSALRFAALRQIAQLAVNIVDYLDPDDVTTPFVWNPVNPLFTDLNAADADPANPNAFPGPNGGANALNRLSQPQAMPVPPLQNSPAGGGVPAYYGFLPPNLAVPAGAPVLRFVDPSADPNNFNGEAYTPGAPPSPPPAPPKTQFLGNQVVFGTELPRLVVNEAHAAVTNDPADQAKPTASKNFLKRFWVELCNPLPVDGDPALSEPGNGNLYAPPTTGGGARLLWPGGAGKPLFNPYRLEVVELPDGGLIGSNTTVGRQMALIPTTPSPLPPGTVATGENVTGDVGYVVAALAGQPPGTYQSPKIRVDNFIATAPNPANPVNELQGPPTAGEPYTVMPLGTTGPGGNPTVSKGCFTLGGRQDNAGETHLNKGSPVPLVVRSRLKDNPAAGPGQPAQDTMSYDTGFKTAGNLVANQKALRPCSIVLRRLANPYLPANDPAVLGGYNPTLPVNLYVTVDVMDNVTARDDVEKDSTSTHSPPTSQPGADRTLGRQNPYANGFPISPLPTLPTPLPTGFALTGPQQPTPNPPGPAPAPPGPPPFHTLMTVNAQQSPFPTDQWFGWLAHLDRAPVSPVELLQVSRVAPYELTARFAAVATVQGTPVNPPGPPNPDQPVWHYGAHTAFSAFAQSASYRGEIAQPDYGQLYRALDVLAVRNLAPGVPVGGPEYGRINLNTVWDDADDPLVLPPDLPTTTPVPTEVTSDTTKYTPGGFTTWQKARTSRLLKAVLDPPTTLSTQDPTAFANAGPRSVSRNKFTPTNVAYIWQPEPTTQPFMRLRRTADVRTVSAADQPFKGFSGAGSANDTLFRTRPDGRPLFFINPANNPYKDPAGTNSTPNNQYVARGINPHTEDPTGTSPYSGGPAVPPVPGPSPYTLTPAAPAQQLPPYPVDGFPVAAPNAAAILPNALPAVPPHLYAQAEPLRKMAASVTTTSDSFLVLLTVGYFDVRTDLSGNPLFEDIDPANGLRRPLIGAEAFREVPGDLRKQYMAVLDRSALTVANVNAAFQPPAAPAAQPNPFTRPGPTPWFTALTADAQPGDRQITVSATVPDPTKPISPTNPPFVYKDGQPVPIPFVTAGGPATAYWQPDPYDPTPNPPSPNPAGGQPLNAIRLGFGDSALPAGAPAGVGGSPPTAHGGDGEWVWVTGASYGSRPGELVLTVSADPRVAETVPPASNDPRGMKRPHPAGSPVSNAVLGSPGPQPPLDLTQSAARGPVPFFHDVPR
jgi:hypothetical protein